MLSKIKNDTFFRNYAVFFSGSMVVAVLNYAFHPILARLMTPSAFGDVQALISLITMTGVLLGAFSVVVVNITANIENPHERDAIIAELQRISFMVIGVAVLALFVGISEIKSFLNFSSVYPLIGLAIILPVGALVTFRNAYLHGSGRFAELSISHAISAFSRLVFAVGLVLLGLGSTGVTIGIILAIVAGYYYTLLRTKKELHLDTRTNVHVLEKGKVRKEIMYGVLVLFATALATFFFSVDVLVIKHFFSADIAGLYSGISVIGKIIFFAVAPAVGVLLYSIKLRNTFRENSVILGKSMLIVCVVGGLGLLTFYSFSDMIISLLIGQKYLQFAYLLPKVGLVMLIASVVNVFVTYFLALRRFFLIFVSFIVTVLTAILLMTDHKSIESVLNTLLIALAITLFTLLFVYAKDNFNNRPRI